jgi:hypothetical protein
VSEETTRKLSEVLRTVSETHHTVFQIVDGADEDWATWYADWLVNLSELPALLGTTPVRSQLTYQLVSLAKEYAETGTDQPWEEYYASRLLERLGARDVG